MAVMSAKNLSHNLATLDEIDSHIAVRSAGRMGRGIFAAKSITAGRLLGDFFSVEIDPIESTALLHTPVNWYVWEHRLNPQASLLPMGWISFLNHSRSPNCRVIWQQTQIGWKAEVWSTRPITSGEQLFIDYGCPDSELGFPQ